MNKHRTLPRQRAKARKPGAPPTDEPWLWQSKSMMESAAYKELVRHRSAIVVTKRIALEHLRHAGKENGRLKVTYMDFRNWGSIDPKQVADGIAIAEHLGFIKVTKRGLASFENQRYPNEYAITWQPIAGDMPTNEWKRIWSSEVAKAKIANAIAQRKAERQANAGRRTKRAQRPRPQRQFIAASGHKGE
jgi:hypothetical protein